MSNNDRQLRIFDMPSMRPVEAICCPAPINYAALSPEGDLLACVGDSGETHLFRAAPSGAFKLSQLSLPPINQPAYQSFICLMVSLQCAMASG